MSWGVYEITSSEGGVRLINGIAHCILHRLNVCGMQYTSYYIGYLLSITDVYCINLVF